VFTPAVARSASALALAWFDEEFIDHDASAVTGGQERNYTLGHQALMSRKQMEIIGRVLPVCREFAASGQDRDFDDRLITTASCRLVCDSTSRGYRTRTPRSAALRYPDDARCQIERAATTSAKSWTSLPPACGRPRGLFG